jgi:hypothetical protein
LNDLRVTERETDRQSGRQAGTGAGGRPGRQAGRQAETERGEDMFKPKLLGNRCERSTYDRARIRRQEMENMDSGEHGDATDQDLNVDAMDMIFCLGLRRFLCMLNLRKALVTFVKQQPCPMRNTNFPRRVL